MISYQNSGCDGGLAESAYDWIIDNNGIVTEESYGQYLQADGYCHYKNATVGARVGSYYQVLSDPNVMKRTLVNNGPLSVGIHVPGAEDSSFIFYSGGVYSSPACPNKDEDLNHAVTLGNSLSTIHIYMLFIDNNMLLGFLFIL